MPRADARRVVIIGADRMARRIGAFLAEDGGFAPVHASYDAEALAACGDLDRLAPLGGPLADALGPSLRGALAVVLAEPGLVDRTRGGADVAQVALRAGCHYLDISESTATGRALAALDAPARSAGVSLVCGCGLAPGYVTSLAAEAVAGAAAGSTTTVFVGVLPARPDNRLGYANIWGISGLIEEYTAPCLVLRKGEVRSIDPLSEAETVCLDGNVFEAFTTAGSLDAVVRDLEGRDRSLVFKTLRYPGHLDYVRFLLDDLGMRKNPYRLHDLLLTALPRSDADRVVVAIRTAGQGSEAWRVETFDHVTGVGGTTVSAVSTATAAHVAAMLELVVAGKLGPGTLAPGAVSMALLRRTRAFRHLSREAPGGRVQENGAA